MKIRFNRKDRLTILGTREAKKKHVTIREIKSTAEGVTERLNPDGKQGECKDEYEEEMTGVKYDRRVWR